MALLPDFPGNYTQYRLTDKDKDDKLIVPKPAPIVAAPEAPASPGKTIEKRKLTYKEKREFELLQKEMADLEKEKMAVTEKLNSASTPFDELRENGPSHRPDHCRTGRERTTLAGTQ